MFSWSFNEKKGGKSINIKNLHNVQKQEDWNIVITFLTNLFWYVLHYVTDFLDEITTIAKKNLIRRN